MGAHERGAGGQAAERVASGRAETSLSSGSPRWRPADGAGASGFRNLTTALSQEQGSAKNLALQANVSVTGHQSSNRGLGGHTVQSLRLTTEERGTLRKMVFES